MDLLSKKLICWPKNDILSRMEIRAKLWVFLLQKSSFCQKNPLKPYYIDLNINAGEHENIFEEKIWPHGTPLGYLGSLSRVHIVEFFQNLIGLAL